MIWPNRRAQAAVLLALCTFGIAYLTLTPGAVNTDHDRAWCFYCAHLSARDITLNILMFMPVGAALAAAGLRARWCIMMMLAASLAIECVQWIAIAGRQASLMDVLTNTTGGAIGVLLHTYRTDWLRPSPLVARMLAVLIGLAWCAQLAVTGWALRPDLAPASRYWGQWAHVFRTTERFPGSVESFTLNGVPIPDDSVGSHEALRQTMVRDGITITATASEGGSVPTRAQIVGLADDRGNLLVGITQEHCGNRLIGRMRGEEYGLASPTLQLSRSCEAGERTTFVGSITSKRLALSATRGGNVVRSELALRPTIGWMLLVPWAGLLRLSDLLTCIWVLCFGLPLAWMLWRTGAGRKATLCIYALVLPGTAVLASLVTGLQAPGGADWVAFGAGGGLAYDWARSAATRVTR